MWRDAEEFLLKDRHLAQLVRRWGHCTIRPLPRADFFEDLVDAICSQQLSGKAAKTIFGRLKDKLDGKILPESLIAIETEELRKCGLSYAKCSYVKDLARKVKDDSLKIESLSRLSDEEVVSELVAVKGIGRWTAEMFLMFSLARPDIFPIDDLGIKKGFEKVTGKSWDKTKSAEFAEKKWKPYRTAASWYLWKSLESA